MPRIDHAFRVGPHNAHYEGEYDGREMRWRRICAVEKAGNLRHLLGARAGSIGSVLEVGCGTGSVLAEVRKVGIGRVHEGVDVTDPMTHVDPDIVDSGIRLRAYDGRRLPFADRSVDLVIATHVLEHVPDERGFLSELVRVASRYLYVEVPCELHLRSTVRRMQASLDIGHINAYTPEGFVLKLVTTGLKVIDVQVLDHVDEVHRFRRSTSEALARMALRRSLLAVSPFLASRVFTYHCAALCATDE